MNVLLVFGLTAIAGLATGIGGAITLFTKKANTKFLSVSLGFSAGVMIYVSMIELFSEARELLTSVYGLKLGSVYTVIGFFGGMFVIAVIDRLIPQRDNPHEIKTKSKLTAEPYKRVSKRDKVEKSRSKLMRAGLFTALAIAIHNIPEGIAALISTQQDLSVAIPIVIAIALHNIPEGIAVSAPIFYATGNRKKAFLYSFASGISEPVAAVLAYFILMPFMNDTISGVLFAGVAGIMVFISIDELLPSAIEFGEHHLSIYGMAAGMAVMAASLLLFI